MGKMNDAINVKVYVLRLDAKVSFQLKIFMFVVRFVLEF